jgi:hypothetical protein
MLVLIIRCLPNCNYVDRGSLNVQRRRRGSWRIHGDCNWSMSGCFIRRAEPCRAAEAPSSTAIRCDFARAMNISPSRMQVTSVSAMSPETPSEQSNEVLSEVDREKTTVGRIGHDSHC